MAVRRPLVQINGQIKELSDTDTIIGASEGSGSGTTVAMVANFSLNDGELVVSHLSSMTPSLVDGEFIVSFETI